MKLRNDRGWQRAGEDLALQVLQNQLLISRVETEPRRQSKLSILHKIHLLHANNIFLCRGGGEDRGKMELLLLDKESKRVWRRMQCGFFYSNGSDKKEKNKKTHLA